MTKFMLPKQKTNFKNEIRKVGFEIEYCNLEFDDAIKVLKEIDDFEVNKINDYLYKLESKLGTFTLELDFELLTKQTITNDFKEFLEGFDINIKKDLEELERFIGDLSKDIVPYELSTPAITFDNLEIIDKLIEKLKEKKAKGTEDKFYYAFGLHLNIELPSLKAEDILDYLRAYVIMQDFLRQDAKIDISREISFFIDDFEKDYNLHILNKDYNPDIDTLIDDYLKYNPTRNKALDMLPLFAYLDEKKVREALPEEKIKPRPAFHYRLSNSSLSDKTWSVVAEFNRWNHVEYLANDKKELKSLSIEYLSHLDEFINLESWEDRIKTWLKNHQEI